MGILSDYFKSLRQWLRSLALVGLLCLVLSWSPSAQAASGTNPQLERQVLQIIREHPEVILESLQAYQLQQQNQLQQTREAFLQDLKTDALKVIGESPTIGAPKAKILLVEFSDFQCPYCAEAHKTLKDLLAKHHNDIRLVYKHFPLSSIHSEAIPAAKAAWAAFGQGKFWEYHDALFTHQQELSEKLYIDIAKHLNLDLKRFEQDRQIASTAIQKDLKLATKLGLSGTPFFIINSATFSGAVQLSDIEKILSNIS